MTQSPAAAMPADERTMLVESIAKLKAKTRSSVAASDPANHPDALLLDWLEETLREFDAPIGADNQT